MSQRLRKIKIRGLRIVVTLGLFLVWLVTVVALPVYASKQPVEGKVRKVVLLYTPAPGHHPNKASCQLFKHCLENSPN